MTHLDQAPLLQLIQDANAVLGLTYVVPTRNIYFTGIPAAYTAGLQIVGAPADQIFLDLGRLNDDVVLANGLVPLEVWLRNVVTRHAQHEKAPVMRELLSDIGGQVAGAPALVELPADTQLRPEAYIGRDETLAFRFLELGHRLGGSVAKLEVPRFQSGGAVRLSDDSEHIALGTGFLLSHDLLITNQHVINARERREGDADAGDFQAQALATRVLFDFDDEGAETSAARVSGLELWSKDLDFAILRLAAPETRPIAAFRETAVPASPEMPFPVNIIQHPGGKPKRVAIRNNLVYTSEGVHLRYRTDTDEGSSGSPVFDDVWNLVALHHAAHFPKGPQATLPVVNQGITWLAIRDELERTAPTLLAELAR